jgi:hypothetical protein
MNIPFFFFFFFLPPKRHPLLQCTYAVGITITLFYYYCFFPIARSTDTRVTKTPYLSSSRKKDLVLDAMPSSVSYGGATQMFEQGQEVLFKYIR